jgi:fibro-slime domain-containing protein
MTSRKLPLLLIVLTMILPSTIMAQDETVWVDVIFYDYHSDGNNPNFEKDPRQRGGIQPDGMIKPYLSTDRRPLLNANHFYNDRVEEWYRPSGAPNAQFDFETGRWSTLVPRPGTSGEYIGPQWSAADPMADIVIYDSLPFTPDPNNPGQYMYDNQSFFPLDGRGFGNESRDARGRLRNYSFAMEIHRQFVYTGEEQFWFRGDDDVWVFINGKLAIDLGGVHGPLVDEIDLTDPATAASFGLEKGKKYDFDFFYAERHVTGSSIWITTNIITVSPDTLELSVSNSTIKAGDTASIAAAVKDQFGELRPEWSDQVTWEIVPQTARPGDVLVGGAGPAAQNRFTATEAYRTVQIRAKLNDPNNPLVAIAPITIVPADPDRAVIEHVAAAPITQAELLSHIDSVKSSPITTIVMDSSTTLRYAYAVIRDRFGNYVSLPQSAVWASGDISQATATATAGKTFEGTLERKPFSTGEIAISVTEPGLKPGNTTLVIRNAVITALKLVYGDDPSQTPLDTIRLNTDQKKEIKVMGQWSDNPGVWVDVTGTWNLNPDVLRSKTPLPEGEAGSWLYDPRNPGQAALTVNTGNKQVSAWVITTPAPPSDITLEILTPTDSLMAGYPIRIKVTISNTDGIHPAPNWCGNAVYSDIIGDGGKERPYVMIDGQKVYLTDAGQECFSVGLDTVEVSLFNAPFDYEDSLHQISVVLDSRISGTTQPFRLLPGNLHHMVIENDQKVALDTVRIDIGGSAMLYAVGYDAWNNRIGGEISNWTAAGELPAVENGTGVPNLWYQPNAIYDTRGTMTANSVANPLISDDVAIIVSSPPATLQTAITRDLNGNGFLDAIEVIYDKKVTLTAQNTITVNHRGTIFQVNTVASASGMPSDSVFYIHLKENTVIHEPQTEWTPLLTITGAEKIQDEAGYPTIDGAGPVIWEVQKHINSVTDRKRDKIVVIFTEDIVHGDGSNFSFTNIPGAVFHVWRDTASVPDTAMLTGIGRFTEVGRDRVVFYMSNGEELTDRHKFTINSPSGLIADKIGNMPVADNHKVPVVIFTRLGNMVVGPNPFPPTFFYPPAEPKGAELVSHDYDQAHDWVQMYGGAMIVADFILPTNQHAVVHANLMVFDAVGNLTYTNQNRSQNGVVPEEWKKDWQSGTRKRFVFYWNGITDRNIKAAPGIYKMVVYLYYEGQQVRYESNVGVRR